MNCDNKKSKQTLELIFRQTKEDEWHVLILKKWKNKNLIPSQNTIMARDIFLLYLSCFTLSSKNEW